MRNQLKHSTSWEESGDGRKLVQLLEKLRECKDDDQQRSWALHEDEHMIITLITQVIDILVSFSITHLKI